MDASLDLSRWREKPRGVGYRRWVIVTQGLRQLFRLRFFKIILGIAWCSSMAMAVLGFAFAQSVADGGWVSTLATYFGPRAQAMSSVIAGMLLLYPDICIGGFYTLLFWLHSFLGLWISLVALTALIPRLITVDRSTNALIVYLARPLTSGDYLLGKLGIIAGVLMALWTGPLLAGWALSVAFAPELDFITYSLEPLGRALLFQCIALVTLSAIALGVSSLTRTARNTTIIWIGLWLFVGFFTVDRNAPVWLQRASFTQNLTQVRSGILRPDTALLSAAEDLPLTNREFANSLSRAGNRTQSTDLNGALGALAAFVAASSFVFLRRIRPE